MNLHNRLEKLEAKAGNDVDKITATFHYIIDSVVDGKPYHAPVVGWRSYEGEEIMRLDGESDESLAERATSIANAKSSTKTIPCFIQIEGEDEKINK